MKKLFKLLAATLLCTFMWSMTVCAETTDKPVIALGADLSADQRATVLSLMGVTEQDLANYTVITITNEAEHKYLDYQSLIKRHGYTGRGWTRCHGNNTEYQLLYNRYVPQRAPDSRSRGCRYHGSGTDRDFRYSRTDRCG